MNKMIKAPLFSLLLLGWALSACAVDLHRQKVAEPGKLPGVYTTVLIGGTFAADAERIVILDVEGDGYSFRPVTPEYGFRKSAGLTAQAGLAAAENFFSPHCAYNGYRVKSLRLVDGTLVGYEVTPDFPPALCESGNIVTVSYAVGAEGEIRVYTRLLLPVDDGGSFGKAEAQREKAAR